MGGKETTKSGYVETNEGCRIDYAQSRSSDNEPTYTYGFNSIVRGACHGIGFSRTEQ
jgi:hypothetical protein